MADSQKFVPSTIYDQLSICDGGMDSNINALLLPKNQLAFAQNMTVRGGFMTDRPPFTNQLDIVWPSSAVQTAFESGLFQASAFYLPDSGDASLFALVSGRLYQFVVSGDTLTVTDRTVTGNPQSTTATQCWMWQSENYLISNDGIGLPVFFDGATSRRSYGPSVLLNLVSAVSQLTAPAIGSTLVLTLTANYTGPFNVPVLFNGAFYQPIENAAGYSVAMENVTDTPGTAINVGDQVVIRGDTIGVIALDVPNTVPGAVYGPATIDLTFTLTEPFTSGLFTGVLAFGKIWTVFQFTGNVVRIRNNETVVMPTTPNLFTFGEVIPKLTGVTPNVVVGAVATAAVAPAYGNSVTVTLNTLYSGAAGQQVFIGDRQYLATAIPSGPPGTALTVINLNDPEGTVYSTTFNQDLLSVPELPAGRMGAYGLTQNWVCLVDGLSYIASDASRGPSGTPANNYRDAVLKTTDLTFRGGNFAIPGAGNVITALTFTTNLDVALGQGSLMVSTAAFMASNLAPFDYLNPPTTGPILTYSLIGFGPLGQDNTISVNSDIYFRSTFGVGSLVLARRDFQNPGNLPISAEMERVVTLDNESLLQYGSAALFDNRIIYTVSPQASSQGVIHAGMIVENLDTLSSLRNKTQPCWDGLWTGINVLKFVTDATGKAPIFNGVSRLFTFTYNAVLTKLELYEMLPTGTDHFDNNSLPITWTFETGSLFNKDVKPEDQLISLRDGEFAVEDVIGTVRFEVYYKADQGCWTPWHAFTICSDKDGEPQYFPRLGLGEPSSTPCNSELKTSARDGYTYQVKFLISGHCRFVRLKLAAVTMPQPKFVPPTCDRFVDVVV